MEKNEKLLCFGKWTSVIGDVVFDYVNCKTIVSQYVNSALILALYQCSESIISIIFNLIGGALADRNSKKKILIITDLLSAILCMGFSSFVEEKSIVYIMIFVNICLSIIHAFNAPTYKAIVRETVLKHRITLYNSISNAGTELMRLLSPLLGVVLVNTLGTKGALQFNALTFFLSALSEVMLINITTMEVAKEKKNIIINIFDGMLYIYHQKQLLLLIITSSLINFFLAGYNLLIPYTDIMYKNVSEDIYSKILIIEAGGSVIGSFLNSQVCKKKNDLHVMAFYLAIMSGCLLFIPYASKSNNLLVCLFPFVIFTICLTMYNIRFVTYIQVRVNELYLGRIFSIIFTISVLFVPLGSIFFSLVLPITSNISFAWLGFGVAIVLALVILGSKYWK